MQRRELLQTRILEALKAAPEGMSALALLCACHRYRHAHKKLLRFSVQERALIQQRRFEEAEQLLKTVLDEADTYYAKQAQKFEARQAKRRKSQERLKAYDMVEPPREVVIQPAERRLVSGNPDYKEEGCVSLGSVGGTFGYRSPLEQFGINSLAGSHLATAVGIDSPILAQLRQMIALGAIGEDILPDVLRPPVYETIPEVRGPSTYALLEDNLKEKLKRYPKVIWQKLPTERHFAEDNKMEHRVLRERQATNRAIDALVSSGRVVGEGERVNARYFLTDDST